VSVAYRQFSNFSESTLMEENLAKIYKNSAGKIYFNFLILSMAILLKVVY
jgi:hypothetical protein